MKASADNLCENNSRFPNYCGDITLWTGMAITVAGVLFTGPVQQSLGWGGISGLVKGFVVAYAAPTFVSWLLLRVSGIPLSQGKYDGLYGHREDYRAWRENTPRLFPRVFLKQISG